MKTIKIIEILKSGKQPIVRLTEQLWDESWGDKGMIARITKFTDCIDGDDMVELTFDYNENKEHNLALQSHNWYLKNGELGTAFEAGDMDEKDIKETVILETSGEYDEVAVELLDKSSLLNEYIESESKLTYVEWLENKCNGYRETIEATAYQ